MKIGNSLVEIHRLIEGDSAWDYNSTIYDVSNRLGLVQLNQSINKSIETLFEAGITEGTASTLTEKSSYHAVKDLTIAEMLLTVSGAKSTLEQIRKTNLKEQGSKIFHTWLLSSNTGF